MAVRALRRLAWTGLSLGLLALPACQARPQAELRPGLTRAQVERLLGEPDQVVWSALPEQGLFGPQEALYAQLEPGDPYEEWLYDLGEEQQYLWFSGSTDDRSSWTLITAVTAPKGVIY